MSTVEASLEGRHRITIFIKSLSSLTRFYRYFHSAPRCDASEERKTSRIEKKIKAFVRHSIQIRIVLDGREKIAKSSLLENAVREGVVRVCVGGLSRLVGASGSFPTDIPNASENEKNFIDFLCVEFHWVGAILDFMRLHGRIMCNLLTRKIAQRHLISSTTNAALSYHKSLCKKRTKGTSSLLSQVALKHFWIMLWRQNRKEHLITGEFKLFPFDVTMTPSVLLNTSLTCCTSICQKLFPRSKWN